MRSFTANLSTLEILKLGTKDNLRTYIAEHNPQKRNSVHVAIASTIANQPERFITRNSGFVITATDVEADDSKKTVYDALRIYPHTLVEVMKDVEGK